jgi:hypothetical protein
MARHAAGGVALIVALALASACGKPRDPAPAAPPAETAAPLDPRLEAMGELAFVPADVEALVRVDLADVARRSADPAQSLKTFDFLLRAQQPVAWQVLSGAGVQVGRELATLFMVVGPRPATASHEAYLVAGVGAFDEARLATELAKTGAKGEDASGARIFVWPRKTESGVGANVPPEKGPRLGDASVGVARGLIIFGAPDLVRRALAVRAGEGKDVRRGPLVPELLAVDAAATLWGVAVPRPPGPAGAAALLPSVLPGLERAHFSTVLAAPGQDPGTGAFRLRAEFSSPEHAAAFQKQLHELLAAADLLGGGTPLGAALSEMRRTAKVTLEGRTLVASSTL